MMMPQTPPNFNASTPYNANFYHNTPTRSGFGQAMQGHVIQIPAMQGQTMSGGGQKGMYMNAFGPAIPMLPMQHDAQFFPQMAPQYFTTPPNVQSHQNQPSPASTSLQSSRSSSLYPDPTIAEDQSSSDWLSRPEPETHSNSGYSSSASTVSPLYKAVQEPHWGSPDHGRSVLGGATEASSNMYAHNSGAGQDQSNGCVDLGAILRSAEAAQDVGDHGMTESDDDEGAVFDSE
jgi:hypothetical protein